MYSFKRGQTGIILRVKLFDSTSTAGAGLIGLTSASSGLIISTIADNEATATAYTQAGGTIESITTLGTFATPTATKVRFKEVDATNHKGVYEIQIDNARYAVSGAKGLTVSLSGATNLAQCDIHIPLTDLDPFDAVRAGLTALPNANANAANGLITFGTSAGQLNVSGGRADADVKYEVGSALLSGTALSGDQTHLGLPATWTSNMVAAGDVLETIDGGATPAGVQATVLSITGSGTATPVANLFGAGWNGTPPTAGSKFKVVKWAGGQIPADASTLASAAAVAAIAAKLPSANAGAAGGFPVLNGNLRVDAETIVLGNAAIDAILDRSIAEPTGPFGWPGSLRNIIAFQGALARNKTITSENGVTLKNSTDTIVIASAQLSLLNGVLTRSAYA